MMKKKNTGGWKAFNLHSLLKKEKEWENQVSFPVYVIKYNERKNPYLLVLVEAALKLMGVSCNHGVI